MVGLMDRQTEISGHLKGSFGGAHFGPISGPFIAKAEAGNILFLSGSIHQPIRSPMIKLTSGKDSQFSLSNVTIGNQFHWERKEVQTFQGDLLFHLRPQGTICVINQIPLEDYLSSVVSSEMSGDGPFEFLKAHAILSRSWLLTSLDRKQKTEEMVIPKENIVEGEMIRWYDREDHDLFDVCADDHCQRYQGILKTAVEKAQRAVQETNGNVIAFRDEICDARYSKCCGGLTENFSTAWGNKQIPYLTSLPDASISHPPIKTEEEASNWILSTPEAYCRVGDENLLKQILPDFDQQTKNFFRWKVEYSRRELEALIRKKSGIDFGTLQEITPLTRGPSGRISRLKIVGSKRSMIIGKELEIRRWLSPSHLYSSAFVIKKDGDRFIFHGAGWGHGVGLCQIGAAVMATQGFSAEEILKHYFQGVEVKKVY